MKTLSEEVGLCLTSYLNVNEELKVVLGASLRVLRTYLAISGLARKRHCFHVAAFNCQLLTCYSTNFLHLRNYR
jgi:hypothetical protein